tara:strand:- start:17391 stop:18329 length:939 start_codon:yes stop_codon:yes gene_type:complete
MASMSAIDAQNLLRDFDVPPVKFDWTTMSNVPNPAYEQSKNKLLAGTPPVDVVKGLVDNEIIKPTGSLTNMADLSFVNVSKKYNINPYSVIPGATYEQITDPRFANASTPSLGQNNVAQTPTGSQSSQEWFDQNSLITDPDILKTPVPGADISTTQLTPNELAPVTVTPNTGGGSLQSLDLGYAGNEPANLIKTDYGLSDSELSSLDTTFNSPTAQSTPSWLERNRDNLELGATGLQALSGIANAYTGYQNLQLAREQFRFNRGVTTQNFNNQANLVNLQLRDSYRQRLAAGQGGNYKNDDDFVAQRGVKKI